MRNILRSGALLALIITTLVPQVTLAQTLSVPSHDSAGLAETLDRLGLSKGAVRAGEEGLLAGCCKTCSKGKACGDSCISRSKSCHKGPGCACDG